MRSQSLQESLLEEILAIDDLSSFSFLSSSEKQNEKQPTLSFQDLNVINKNQNHEQKPTLRKLEEKVLKMRKPVGNGKKVSAGAKKIKTQESQKLEPQILGCKKTRRGSLENISGQDKSFEKGSKYQSELDSSACTYQPSINQTSRVIIEKLDRQSLYNKMKQKTKEQAQRIKQEQQINMLKQCSFTPNIEANTHKKSKVVIEKEDIFENLYLESQNRKARQKEKQNENIAIIRKRRNPRINHISNKIVTTDFNTRMTQFESRKAEKEKMRKQKEQKEKSNLFHPKVNHATNHRHNEVSIGEYLHSQTKRNHHKESSEETSQQVKASYKSSQVYEERKIIAFYQIFKLLDEDKDGVISSQNINVEILPREVLKIIYPLIDEIEEMEVQLKQYQFIESLQNLFKTISIHERNILLGFTPTPKKIEDYDFQPSLNSRSMEIAGEIHRDCLNISQFCGIRQKQRKRHLQNERVKQTKMEMEKCTFQPKIITKYPY